MSAFVVTMENRPGQLARLCEAMAAANVNIVLSGMAHAGGGTVAFIADDEAAARGALQDSGMEFAERPALTVRLPNVSGAGAAAFRALAEAAVNVDLLLPVRVSDEDFYAVLCVQDLDAARQALGDQVIDA